MAGWALCMALLLAALAGTEGETRYQKFLRQHVDYPQTSLTTPRLYCTTMLMRRGVTVTGQPCKPSNTFVHAPSWKLVAACSQTPDAAGLYTTPVPLSLTACRLHGGNTRPPCSYRALQFQHYVRVACSNGLPVHLAGTYAVAGTASDFHDHSCNILKLLGCGPLSSRTEAFAQATAGSGQQIYNGNV